MSRDLVQPNGWVGLKLPNEDLRILEVVPNTTISLGKYGSFPSNLIIHRPFHLTYEVQDKRAGESFSRLRVVPGDELNADVLAETPAEEADGEADGDDVIAPADGEELTLVDESGQVVARSTREIIDDPARQTLTTEEIEELKRHGASAGKELVAKLLLSHTAIDQKTTYSLAKYKLLKTKKYIRRFTVLPLDVPLLGQWLLEDRDAAKVLEIRQEMLALVGCWADVHFGGLESPVPGEPQGGRWLVVDDTGGLLVACLAERMGFLHQEAECDDQEEQPLLQNGASEGPATEGPTANGSGEANADAHEPNAPSPNARRRPRKRPWTDDFGVPYAANNTLTLIHSNHQPNLSLLRYFNYDPSDPNPPYPYHPLFTNILPISWLQLLAPEEDPAYAAAAPDVAPEELASWKANRRGNYHRKRRRWARMRHIVDATRAGGHQGLAVASTMEPISVVASTLPLLAGGAPIAIYSPSIEPLTQLADCFSVARRTAWVSNPPPAAEGRTVEELERWEGSPDFPINPTLLLGATIQTTRAKRWQVLPGRTHPLMMGKGGAEGYVFTGWRSMPVEGKIAARGRFKRKKTEGGF